MLIYSYYSSPIGLLEITISEIAIKQLLFVEEPTHPSEMTPLLKETVTQLDQYFNEERKIFSLPLDPEGTLFQQKVWHQLQTIPYGQVSTYGDIASLLQQPKAVRAIGAANGKNPISIIIPCHRVIGANNKLVGYAGGIWRKEWLLKHEHYLLL